MRGAHPQHLHQQHSRRGQRRPRQRIGTGFSARPGPAKRGRHRFHRRTRTRCPARPQEARSSPQLARADRPTRRQPGEASTSRSARCRGARPRPRGQRRLAAAPAARPRAAGGTTARGDLLGLGGQRPHARIANLSGDSPIPAMAQCATPARAQQISRPQSNGPPHRVTPARPTSWTARALSPASNSPAWPPTRSPARLAVPPGRALAALEGRPAAPRAVGEACRLRMHSSVAAVGPRRILPLPGPGTKAPARA